MGGGTMMYSLQVPRGCAGPARLTWSYATQRRSGRQQAVMLPSGYGTFRLNFHHFHRFELDLRGHTRARGAAFSCLRSKLADIVLI